MNPAELTYDAYLAEPEVSGRYDIINGVRVFMASPVWKHQRIAMNVTALLREFEKTTPIGFTITSPFDVLIRRFPKLQTRQPDVLFISHARLAGGGGIPDTGPLEVAPELIVEVVSSNETQRILGAKLADYQETGVSEAWIIRPDDQTVEVLRLTPTEQFSLSLSSIGEQVISRVFPALQIPVAAVFLP